MDTSMGWTWTVDDKRIIDDHDGKGYSLEQIATIFHIFDTKRDRNKPLMPLTRSESDEITLLGINPAEARLARLARFVVLYENGPAKAKIKSQFNEEQPMPTPIRRHLLVVSD